MTAYAYRAMSSTGEIVTGLIDAPDEAAVVAHIRERGQYPVSASLANSTRLAGWVARFGGRRRVSVRRLSMATQELATLLAAGLDLDRALSVVERVGEAGALQNAFAAVRTRVHDGAMFADALAGEGCFPALFVNMVRAGELGGTLEPTLRRLSDYLTRSASVRDTITSALLYPVILLATAGLSIVFILTFVLPEFQPLFSEAGRALPWPTRIVMGLGDFVRGFWWALVIGFAAIVFGVQQLFRRPEWRVRRDRWSLRIPVMGALIAAIDIERFSRMLGTLLSQGVPLPSALPLAQEVIANRVLASAVGESAAGLREGEALADGLEHSGTFPPVTVDLIRVGEETAKLDHMLLRQADLDEERIRHTVNRLLAILVPALTILLGLMVGGLIASLLTAILSINDLALPQ